MELSPVPKMLLKPCGAGHEIVGLTHPATVAKQLRELGKAERSLQRKQRDDRLWAMAMVNRFKPRHELDRLLRRVTRRARVMYARLDRLAGVR